MRALRHKALQKEFIEQHLEPLAVDFAIVKGLPLGQRYYAEPHTRISRDIDVWMPVKDMIPVIRSAQASGFVVYPYAQALTDTALAIHFKTRRDIGLYDHRGILVELDQRLDKSEQIFKIDEELPHCEQQIVDGVSINVLSTTLLFIYLCLHHTRHRWSKLVWLADIQAVQSAPDFDPQAVEDRARAMGVWDTVEATLKFDEACRQPDPWARASQDNRVSDMLKDCQDVFIGGRKQEIEGYQTRITKDFPYAWQLNEMNHTADTQRNSWSRRLASFRPTLSDYFLLPLPLSLYPLYYLLKPFLPLLRKLQRYRTARHMSHVPVHKERESQANNHTPPCVADLEK